MIPPLHLSPSDPMAFKVMMSRAARGSGPGWLQDQTVAALHRETAYAEGGPVDVIETHRSFVFLTKTRAYKLARLGASEAPDRGASDERRRAAEREVRLNRRLAASVYLGLVPVTLTDSGVIVNGAGVTVDWLIEMRRLPRELMLDTRISERTLRTEEIDALARALAQFYARTRRTPLAGHQYHARILRDGFAKTTSLMQPRYDLEPEPIVELGRARRAWLKAHRALLERRAEAVVDAHGDLRPEHVCLEPEPVVIDCLEFDRELRRLDPLSELAFLALECRRLGAPWAAEELLAAYARASGSPVPRELVSFYQSQHALIRAAIAIWHLDDPEDRRAAAWRARAQRYIELGLEALEPRSVQPES